jgi:uncharacterized protein (DUF58 family)
MVNDVMRALFETKNDAQLDSAQNNAQSDKVQDNTEALMALRSVQIATQRLASLQLSGAYRSTFRGQGLEFREVRQYEPGDDVRTIDWNVSARMNEPFIKVFSEERELSIFLLVDTSQSLEFGTTRAPKRRVAAEICALLAMSAALQGDRVGLIAGANSVERFIAPKKGKKHVFRILSDVTKRAPFMQYGGMHYGGDPAASVTRLGPLLEALAARRRSVAFLISDFFCHESDQAYETQLMRAMGRHDIVPVVLEDPRDGILVDIGLASFEDLETGEVITLDTSSRRVREQVAEQAERVRQKRVALFQKLGLQSIVIQTDGAFADQFRRFFKERARRRR